MKPEQAAGMLKVLEDITAERGRQIEVKGWTPEYDDLHTSGHLASAAAAYADHAAKFRNADVYATKAPNPLWPWDIALWKPKSPRRDLVKAAALIVAEIERIDRAPHYNLSNRGAQMIGEESTREMLAREFERRDLKVAAACARTGGAIIGNSPAFDASVLAAMQSAYKAGWDDQCDVVSACLV